ncbi:glycosyltransferase, partial [Kandleria sp.]|uniref:glycosyltransferase n=1 Tax=Kandleria sp. TaxID=2774291 RepID=UPI001B744311
KYINVGKNLGSAGAQARGIKEAVLQGYKYIWLMDDDVIPNKDALVELVRVDNELDGNWGILSSVAYWTDGEICKPNRQKKTLFRFIKDNDYNKHLVRALMVSAASMYVNADAVKDVGLPIAEYFFYTDDYEFSGRISRKYPVYVVPSSKVTHAIKVNMKANIVKDTQDRMYRYQNLYRNDVHCYRQYGMKGNIYLITKFIYTYMMVLAKEKKYRKQKIDILVKGYHDGLLFKPEIEKL